MAPHSSALAWKIPWMEEPGRLQSMGSRRVRQDFTFNFHFPLSCIGEGNGNSLQCSCLENPRDWGAWWAAVYGVPQSRTQLKRLSSSSSIVSLFILVQLLSHVWLCDPMDCSMPGFPVLHYLPGFAQTHVHWVDDAIQLSHPLSSPSPPALNIFQHESLF